LNSNIEGLKNKYEFVLEIRSLQIRTSFNNPSFVAVLFLAVLNTVDTTVWQCKLAEGYGNGDQCYPWGPMDWE